MPWRVYCSSRLEAVCFRFRMLGEALLSLSSDVSKSSLGLCRRSSHIAKTKFTGIQGYPVPNLLIDDRLETKYRLNG